MKDETIKLLLDENCQLSKKHRRKDMSVDTAIEIIGKGISDKQLREFAKKENYIVVTKDQNFITESVRQKVPVALYYDGYAFRITAEPIELLDQQARGSGKIPP